MKKTKRIHYITNAVGTQDKTPFNYETFTALLYALLK